MRAKIYALSLVIAALSACSLEQTPNHSTFTLDLSKTHFAKTRLPVFPDPAYVGHFNDLSNLFMSANDESAAPQTIGGFSCFGVNVTAHDIPSSNSKFAANFSNDPDCTYPGISSSLVTATSTGASIELDVPTGTDRLIQVIGLQTTSGSCSSSGVLTDHIFDSDVTGAYELGRAIGEISAAANVTIKNRFTPDNLKKPFACPLMQMYAYVVNDGAPEDDNTGRGSVQGVVQGYKVDRSTGALTLIPGATQTTHGVIDSWSAVAASHAGKWLYVYVDDYDGDPLSGPYSADGTVDDYNALNYGAGNGGCGGVANRLFQDAEIDVYSIDASTGGLTPVQVVRVGEDKGYDCNYGAVTVDPYDQLLFVGYGDNVAAYQIDQSTGALQSSPQILSSSAPSLSGFAISPGGNAIYTPDITNLSAFSVGTSLTAPLAAMSPATYDIDGGGSAPYQISIDPEGRFMYTANQDVGDAGISQFTVDDDGGLTLIPGPADKGNSYPKVLVDPYYGVTLYGADVTNDGVKSFPILVDGSLGDAQQTALVPDTAAINTLNDIEIDPWSNFIIASYDSGYLVTFGLNRDGTFSGAEQSLAVSGASNPAAVAIALVPQ